MATAALGDFMKGNPKHKQEAQADSKLLRSQKLAENEAEIEKIKNTFMIILRDIKKDIEDNKTPEQPATAEFLQTIREKIKAARQEKKPVATDDIIAAMITMVGQTAALDDKSVELFKQLVQGMLSNPNE